MSWATASSAISVTQSTPSATSSMPSREMTSMWRSRGGRLAGYFARQCGVFHLNVSRSREIRRILILPFTFEISIGVRKGDASLKRRTRHRTNRRHHEIAETAAIVRLPSADSAAAPRSIAEKMTMRILTWVALGSVLALGAGCRYGSRGHLRIGKLGCSYSGGTSAGTALSQRTTEPIRWLPIRPPRDGRQTLQLVQLFRLPWRPRGRGHGPEPPR